MKAESNYIILVFLDFCVKILPISTFSRIKLSWVVKPHFKCSDPKNADVTVADAYLQFNPFNNCCACLRPAVSKLKLNIIVRA